MTTPPKLTREQYISFLDGKSLEQMVKEIDVTELDALFASLFNKDTPQSVAKPAQQSTAPPGPTQKEKDALLASLAAQKDNFPSTLLSLQSPLPRLHASPFS